MKITFWGAARQVTGSMHLLETDDGAKILVDCGLAYEKKTSLIEGNKNFPFNPKEIDAVILTHAHIDHSGNLPNLVKQGFNGPIYCTAPTAELSRHLLNDSLIVQQIEGGRSNNKKGGNKKKTVETLYNSKHIAQTVNQFQTISFYSNTKISDLIAVELVPAGHILGAASAIITIQRIDNVPVKIGFTGDIGNYSSKLLPDPQPMKDLDFIVSESTYGGRFHSDSGTAEEVLLHYIKETCVKYSGKVIIPAFSVGRTQAILFTLNQLWNNKLLPNLKIFTDSPLAIKSTRLYESGAEYLNEETLEFAKQTGSIFDFDALYTITDPKQSEIISNLPEPCVIVSAAGMVEGGRIQQHVRQNISNPYSTILIAGFCAEGTLGHELLQGKSTIMVNKKERPVYANIAKTDAFSAHPDQNGLMRYLTSCNYSQIKKVFLVHSEVKSAEALAKGLATPNVIIPEKGITYELS